MGQFDKVVAWQKKHKSHLADKRFNFLYKRERNPGMRWLNHSKIHMNDKDLQMRVYISHWNANCDFSPLFSRENMSFAEIWKQEKLSNCHKKNRNYTFTITYIPNLLCHDMHFEISSKKIGWFPREQIYPPNSHCAFWSPVKCSSINGCVKIHGYWKFCLNSSKQCL